MLDYGADYPELLPFLEQLAPPACSLPAATRVSPEMSDLDGYSQAVRKFYARLKLEQLDPSTYDASLTLTGMFIPQHARECIQFLPRAFDLPKELPWQLLEQSELEVSLLDPEELERHRRGYLAQAPRPILELMATLSRLVILGDPGSGKSTLLQYLLLHWAEAAPGADGCGLPLLVELGDYARLRQLGRVHDFLEYLHQGSSVPWRFERSALAAWLDNQPSLLLFDGLDEVIDPALRRETVTAIQRLVAEYPRARIVVTSRVIGFQHQAWRDHGFQHVMLEEFDGAQIEDFLRRWHERAYELPARRKAKEELLRSSIAESGAISQLARNPLLLTMMAIVNRTQDLPRDRAELYEQCARLLLHHWKADLALANDPRLGKASLDFKDKRLLLMRVARAMQREPGSIGANLIEESALENALASGLVDVRQVEPQQAARALIQQLRGRNFMLSSLGGRAYAFVHRSFLEYFCALEICERFQAERTLTPKQLQTEIFGHWRDEAWEEVLCLLAGMLAPRFVAGVLDFLRRQKANGAIFLAGRCVGEVRDRDALGAAADRILKALKRRATMGTWVAPVVGVITGQHFTYPFNVRALRLIASVWSSTPGTREWVSEQVSNSVLRRFAVEVLAETWGGDPEAFAVLQNAVYQEPLEAWRTLWVIGENCRDNPQTLPFIKTFSQTGPAYIRDQALSVLADVWKDAPETLVFIKQRVESEFAQGGAFCAATQVLLHHWGPSEALPLVRSIATSSGDPAARERVLKVLAHWNSERTFDSSLRTKACRLIEELQGPP